MSEWFLYFLLLFFVFFVLCKHVVTTVEKTIRRKRNRADDMRMDVICKMNYDNKCFFIHRCLQITPTCLLHAIEHPVSHSLTYRCGVATECYFLHRSDFVIMFYFALWSHRNDACERILQALFRISISKIASKLKSSNCFERIQASWQMTIEVCDVYGKYRII